MLSKRHFQCVTPAIVWPLVTSARNPSLPRINCVARLTIFNAHNTHFLPFGAPLAYQSLLYTSQDVLNLHAQIITSCHTIQNVEWSDALVDTNDELQWVYSITYKANEWCAGKSIPYNFWCPWTDRHFLQLQHACNGPPQNLTPLRTQ